MNDDTQHSSVHHLENPGFTARIKQKHKENVFDTSVTLNPNGGEWQPPLTGITILAAEGFPLDGEKKKRYYWVGDEG